MWFHFPLACLSVVFRYCECISSRLITARQSIFLVFFLFPDGPSFCSSSSFSRNNGVCCDWPDGNHFVIFCFSFPFFSLKYQPEIYVEFDVSMRWFWVRSCLPPPASIVIVALAQWMASWCWRTRLRFNHFFVHSFSLPFFFKCVLRI